MVNFRVLFKRKKRKKINVPNVKKKQKVNFNFKKRLYNSETNFSNCKNQFKPNLRIKASLLNL